MQQQATKRAPLVDRVQLVRRKQLKYSLVGIVPINCCIPRTYGRHIATREVPDGIPSRTSLRPCSCGRC
jgi:hypothetical protein